MQKRIKLLKTLIPQDHLNKEQRDCDNVLLDEYHEIFLLPGDKLGLTAVVQYEIPLKDDTLIHSKQYRHARIHREVIRKDIKLKHDKRNQKTTLLNLQIAQCLLLSS